MLNNNYIGEGKITFYKQGTVIITKELPDSENGLWSMSTFNLVSGLPKIVPDLESALVRNGRVEWGQSVRAEECASEDRAGALRA